MCSICFQVLHQYRTLFKLYDHHGQSPRAQCWLHGPCSAEHRVQKTARIIVLMRGLNVFWWMALDNNTYIDIHWLYWYIHWFCIIIKSMWPANNIKKQIWSELFCHHSGRNKWLSESVRFPKSNGWLLLLQTLQKLFGAFWSSSPSAIPCDTGQ